MESPFVAGFVRMFDEVIKALRRYGDCDIYADKMDKFERKKMLESYLVDDKPIKCGSDVFKSLVHGDLWVNNVMYKFNDENEAEEVILFDFQMCFWGSPMIDVLSVLMTSIRDDVKVEYFDKFIEFYHYELSEALKLIGYEHRIPSLAEISTDVMENGALGKVYF